MKLHAYLSALNRQPFLTLLSISLVAWVFLLIQPSVSSELLNMPVESHNHHAMHVQPAQDNQLWSAILQATSLNWILMLITMMVPLLSESVLYIWRNNFPRKRYSGLFAFFMGYTCVWSCIGIVLFYLNELLFRFFDYKQNLMLSCLVLIMVIWQTTPFKQRSLNRCHFTSRINPFGIHAEISSFQYGIKKAFYCVGTCWALMWISLFTMPKTMYFMPIFTLIMFIEQAQPWQPEHWKIPYKKYIGMKAFKRKALKTR